MRRHKSSPALLRAALGLCALSAGCGEAQSAAPAPVQFQHGAPTAALPDWRYAPAGDGLRRSAAQLPAADRSIHYGMALRTASLKLVGDLPPLEQIMKLDLAAKAGQSDGSDLDPQALYGRYVQGYLDDTPRFARQMLQYFRDTLRTGGTTKGLSGSTNTLVNVDLEPLPRFAARLAVEGRDMRELFSADRNTCPGYTAATGVFTDGSCQAMSGIAEGDHAGVLTHPSFQAQYYGNLAFRRARLVQELFACSKYPAEFSKTPQQLDGVLYISPWPRGSITSTEAPPTLQQRKVRGAATPANSAIPIAKYRYVSFDLVCAGCHATLNRVAPLFMNFDGAGKLQPISMVQVPIDDNPFAQIADYLPAGSQQTAWRFGQPTANLKALGQAIAADPQVAKCFVIRAWNHAFSKADVVNDLALVPDAVIQDLAGAFAEDGYVLKKALHRIYTHPNFIRF